ncbi:MAG: DUF1223 domain-containing protein [Pseudomonadota bacterium]
MRMQKRGRAWALALATLAAAMAGPTPGQAQSGAETPVVVELFTSQGCNSCPPADALLGELTAEPGVIGLTYNVDYWNYLGWRDRFSKPAHTERQRAYASSLGASSIYTPQMVVQGDLPVPGNRREAVDLGVAEAQARAGGGEIRIFEEDGALKADLVDIEPDAMVFIASFRQEEEVKIRRGENAGRTLTYHNVVRELSRVGSAKATGGRLMLPQPRRGEGIAIWAQRRNSGAVLAAERHLHGAAVSLLAR